MQKWNLRSARGFFLSMNFRRRCVAISKIKKLTCWEFAAACVFIIYKKYI